MNYQHAVVYVDHHHARIVQIGPACTHEQLVNAHLHLKNQNERNVLSKNALFATICDAVEGVALVMVVGCKAGIVDFENFSKTHRPEIAQHIAGYLPVDHQTGNELLTFARDWFVTPLQMADCTA